MISTFRQLRFMYRMHPTARHLYWCIKIVFKHWWWKGFDKRILIMDAWNCASWYEPNPDYLWGLWGWFTKVNG